jgi:hypothetical protein
MVRASNHRHLNTAGLEADVMRFMAIIAFCLIAMMALVKDVEPPIEKESGSNTHERPEVAALVKAPPVRQPVPEADPGLQPVTAMQIAVTEVIIQKEPVSKPIPHISITKVLSTSNSSEGQIAEEEQINEERVEEQVAEEQTPQNPEPEPLTFRFESDKTFLHLISTNRLQLYAQSAEGFLEMDNRFNISESRPSGELFEIMAQSIPPKIQSIFKRINTSPVYLVALPVETRRDLNNFLGTRGENSTSGVLIIHRNGRISHEI